MRQPVLRGVAPLNTSPKWPEGYVAVLREAGALEKTIPFYYERFRGIALAPRPDDAIPATPSGTPP